MNILIVDTDKNLISVLKHLGELELFTVDICNSIDHCSNFMFQKDYHVVLIDFTIEDGRQIIDIINDINPKQRIITVSSELVHCNSEGVEYCNENYNKLRLMKPLDLHELIYYINNFDSLSCKYADKFSSSSGIVSIMPELLRRFGINVSYDENTKTINTDNIKHLIEIVDFLESHGIQHDVNESRIVISNQ